MAQTLKVSVIGDTRGYSNALNSAAQDTETFGSKVGNTFAKVGKIVGIGALAAGAVAAEIGKKSVEAAISAQEANDKLTQALKNQGIQMDATSAPILKLEASSRDLGFTNNDTRESFTKLIQSGKGVALSTKEVGAAQDLARAKGISLGDATTGLIRLQAGNTRAAKEFGVVLPPVTANVDKLKASKIDLTSAAGKELLAHAKVQDKLATGQAYYDQITGKVKDQGKVFADSAAGGMARFHAALGNIEEKIGAHLLPVLGKGLKGVDNFLNKISEAPSTSDKFRVALEQVGFSAGTSDSIMAAAARGYTKSMEVIRKVVSDTVSTVQGLWHTWGDTITKVADVALSYVIGLIRNFAKIIEGIFQVIHGLLTGDWSQLWDGLKNIFSGVVGLILTELRAWWGLVKIGFGLLWDGIKAVASAAWDGIQSVLQAAWDAIKRAASAAWDGITGVITRAKNNVVAVFSGIGHAIAGFFEDAWAGIKRGAIVAALAVVEPFSHLPSKLGGWARSAKDSMQAELEKLNAAAIAEKLVNQMDDKAGEMRKAGARLADSLAKGVTDGLAGQLLAVGQSIAAFIASAGAYASKHTGSTTEEYAAKTLGVPIAKGVVAGAESMNRILGASLVKLIQASLAKATAAAKDGAATLGDTISKSTVKGMGNAAPAIIAAAKKVGVDARAALAVAMSEGGTSFGAVGDKGTSFGPFQLHIGGANPYGDPKKAAEFANSLNGITYALKQMAAAGAAGKTGYDAISAIVRGFERPADPAGEIKRAMEFFNQIPEAAANAITQGGTKMNAASMATLTGIGNLVKQYAPIIGLEHARGIIAGMFQGQPGVVAQAKALLEAAHQAQLQKIKDAKAAFVGAFSDLANAALAAFDKKMEEWKPPSSILLQKLQLQDQIGQMTDGLGPAVNEAEQRLAAAFTSGNKQAIDQAQNDLDAALTNSFNAVDFNTTNMLNAAQATLAQAQAEGDPDKIATAQAAYDQALTDRTTALNQNIADQRALVEQNLTYRADAEQRTHDAIAAKQREGLAKQLAQLQTWLLQHPKKWAEMAGKVQAILNDPKYKITLENSGTAWANKFAAGITAGIPAAVKAAHALAAAVAAELPSKKSPLKPAKQGPLAFHPYQMGKEWAASLGTGLADGGLHTAMGTMTMPAGATGFGGGGAAAPVINVYVSGTVVTENQLVDAVYRGLVRKSGRNAGNLGLA